LVLYVLENNIFDYDIKNTEILDRQKTAVKFRVCPYVVGSVLLNVTKVG